MTAAHTPLPWHYVYGAVWTTPDGPEDGGACIATRHSDAPILPWVRDANLAYIVRACNAYPALEAAARLTLDILENVNSVDFALGADKAARDALRAALA